MAPWFGHTSIVESGLWLLTLVLAWLGGVNGWTLWVPWDINIDWVMVMQILALLLWVVGRRTVLYW